MAKRKCILEAEKSRESERYQNIKQDILDQMERNGTYGKYYIDLVDDYMQLWITKGMLVSDINTRGVTVPYNNGGGQSGNKKNDSVEQLLKVNTQMLKIIESIGIKPSTSRSGDEDDEL